MIAVEAIRAARERLAEALLVTPCIPAHQLSQELGAEVRVKCESLQRTGSFKPRGALNKMLQLPAAVRQRGVICSLGGGGRPPRRRLRRRHRARPGAAG